MNYNIKEKREVLKTLSRAVSHMAKDEGLKTEDYTVNQLIMKFAYNLEQEFSFKSFFGWKNEGYTIKKGSRAYMVWGQPISTSKQEEENEEENNGDFFPIAYLFRNDQVLKPIRKEQPAAVQKETVSMVDDLPF